MIQLNTQLISFVAGTVIPFLVGLVAKQKASSGLKAILNVGLAAAAGAAATIVTNHGAFDWQTGVYGMAVCWITSVAAYHGLWKPTGAAPAVQSATAGFGVGSKTGDAEQSQAVRAQLVDNGPMGNAAVSAQWIAAPFDQDPAPSFLVPITGAP